MSNFVIIYTTTVHVSNVVIIYTTLHALSCVAVTPCLKNKYLYNYRDDIHIPINSLGAKSGRREKNNKGV